MLGQWTVGQVGHHVWGEPSRRFRWLRFVSSGLGEAGSVSVVKLLDLEGWAPGKFQVWCTSR